MNSDLTPPADPWTLFAEWFSLASVQEASYPDAMLLATVGEDGMPSTRTVLMKSYDTRGIVFHTNRESRKARQLALHSQAAVTFYWKSLLRQIQCEGIVSIISDDESDAYFATRPRGSQIGAWASLQSRPLPSRDTLEQRIVEFEKKFEGQDVARPPGWGGYRLMPSRIEFWQERTYRLHDRFIYSRLSDEWVVERLFP